MKFALIEAERTHHDVSVLARVLGVSREGYYAWRRRGGESVRKRKDRTLTTKIVGLHAASRGTYGAPRIHADLAAAGEPVSRKRVARLMRTAGLQGVHRRLTWRYVTTDPLPASFTTPTREANTWQTASSSCVTGTGCAGRSGRLVTAMITRSPSRSSRPSK